MTKPYAVTYSTSKPSTSVCTTTKPVLCTKTEVATKQECKTKGHGYGY